MTETATETLSVVVERDIAYPPEKVWRALTQPYLIAEWLMKTDFAPVAGRAFKFTADWGSVDCQVLTLESERALAYSWGAHGLDSIVTWTLTPVGSGTHLRMEQSGFRSDQRHFYEGALSGWPRFMDSLEAVLVRAV